MKEAEAPNPQQEALKPVQLKPVAPGLIFMIALALGMLLIAAGFGAGTIARRLRHEDQHLSPGVARRDLSHMLAFNPDTADEELGLGGEAFPVTLDAYWDALNTIVPNFYNPTPVSLLSDTGREIVADPNKLRTHLSYAAIQGVLSSLNDPYTRFMDPPSYREMQQDNSGSFAGIGAQLIDKDGKIVIQKPLPDTPAARAGVMPMDILVAINGKRVDRMTSENAVHLIRGRPGTTVELTLLRGKKELTFRIVRDTIRSLHYESKIIDGVIGYMHLMLFDEQAGDNIARSLRDFKARGVRALILDLRDNPGGLLDSAVHTASKFIPPGPVVFVQERGGQRSPLPTDRDARANGHLPLVVLVNHFSASASEILAGAVKDTRSGTVMGLTTWGKGLVQEVIPLNDNSAIALTTEHYYTPSGSDINKKGVVPDIRVGHELKEPDTITPQDVPRLLKLRDDIDKEQLDAAVNLLRETLHLPPHGAGSQVARNPSEKVTSRKTGPADGPGSPASRGMKRL